MIVVWWNWNETEDWLIIRLYHDATWTKVLNDISISSYGYHRLCVSLNSPGRFFVVVVLFFAELVFKGIHGSLVMGFNIIIYLVTNTTFCVTKPRKRYLQSRRNSKPLATCHQVSCFICLTRWYNLFYYMAVKSGVFVRQAVQQLIRFSFCSRNTFCT